LLGAHLRLDVAGRVGICIVEEEVIPEWLA
jgi:hypothetical protein